MLAGRHRPYTGAIGNLVFKLATKFKIVQPWDTQNVGAYAMLPGPGTGGAGTRAEAERRRSVSPAITIRSWDKSDVSSGDHRALALQALDARVTKPTPEAGAGATAGSSAPTVTANMTVGTTAEGESIVKPVEAAVKPETAKEAGGQGT